MFGEPLSLALAASGHTLRLMTDPIGIAILAVRLGVTAFGIASGLALWRARPGGPAMARTYLIVASVVLVLMVVAGPPTDLLPGTAERIAAVIVVQNMLWLVYLSRSRQVRARFSGEVLR
jgi:hypothetical protein